jgi:Arc/MetJ family transcription regulator
MRTTVEVDQAMVDEAMRRLGIRTKRELFSVALERLLAQERRKDLLEYFGSGVWEGDLDELRRDRPR